MQALKFTAKNNLFNRLKYEEPKYEQNYFSYYKGLDMDEQSVFDEDLTQLAIDFYNEVKENRYAPLFDKYIIDTIVEVNELISELNKGYNDVHVIALKLLEYGDFEESNAIAITKMIPWTKLRRTNIQKITSFIVTQSKRCQSVTEELSRYIDKPSIENGNDKRTYQSAFAVQKVDSKLNKKDLITLFWLLYQANILKFADNTHLINFIENNFRYLKGGKYNDISNVKIELSRMFPDEFDRSKQMLMRDMDVTLREFQNEVLKYIEDHDTKPPGKHD